jgi:hypothetical protein
MISRVHEPSILVRTHTTQSRRCLRPLPRGVPQAQLAQQEPLVEAAVEAVEVEAEEEAALRAQARAQARVPLPPR